MQYDKEIIPVCELCKDLAEQKSCAKCGIEYCEHYASNIDIRFCGNCMRTVVLTVETEIRKTEHHNDDGEITYTKRDVCKRLRLTGTDYFFAAHQISSLNDDDLDTTIEYHRAIMSAMVMEREDRRVEKFQKISKIILSNKASRTDVDSTGAIKGSLKNPKDKTVKVTKKNDSNALLAALQTLLNAGLTQDQISNLSKGKVQ